jgi:hypothetical protein
MKTPQSLLPREILDRATLRGKEYAWRLEDIPTVIKAARRAALVNIGGQLQFRFPDGGTCECYWVEVDTFKSVSKTLPWKERVARTADAALADFKQLPSKYDFLQEGWRGFGKHLQEIVDQGRDPAEFMCFVWYVTDAETAG